MAAKEKNYSAIAKQRIVRPATQKRLPKFLIYSRNKKGKTTFGISAGVENTLVLDPERGTEEMRTKNPHVWPIDKWTDMDEAWHYLRFEDHPFEWVSVDGLTKICNLALKHVMKIQEERSLDRIPGLVQQRDYGKSGELVKDMLTNFHNLNQGVIFTAQERQVEANDSEEDEDVEDAASMYVPDLPKGARGAANSIVDVIGRLYVVKAEGTDGTSKAERRLWIGESVKYDTGYRSDFALPDMIRNPTVPKLVNLIRTGQVATKKKSTIKLGG